MITRRSTPSARDARTLSLAPRFGMLVIALVAMLSGLFTAQHANAQNPFGDIPGLSNPAPEVPAGQEVVVSARLVGGLAAPGGQALVEVTFDIAEGWKVWPSASQDVLPPSVAQDAIRTAVWLADTAKPQNLIGDASALEGFVKSPLIGAIGETRWPKTGLSKNPLGSPPEVEVIKGEARVYLPILIAADAPLGEGVIPVAVYYQSCSAQTCLFPSIEVHDVPVTIVEGAGVDYAGTGLDSSVFDGLIQGGDLSEGSGYSGGASAPQRGIVVLFFFALLGGAVLNLMPCVLPVIPLKIMALSKHAQGSRSRTLFLGMLMALGVAAFWITVGIPVIATSNQVDPSAIFGIWWVTATMGAVIIALGIGMMGLFTMSLPKSAYMFNPQADSAPGAFLFGVMTAVLGLPCFGPIVGLLLAGGAALPWTSILAVFVGIGVGMGAPYLVLAAFPGVVKKIPQSGPLGELIKQFLSIMMLAAGLYFLASGVGTLVTNYPWIGAEFQWVLAGLVLLAGCLWIFAKAPKATKSALGVTVLMLLGLATLSGTAIFVGDTLQEAYIEYRDNDWKDFSEETIAKALEEDKAVFIDFTAKWCLSCKAAKTAVLNVNPVRSRLREGDVVMIKADFDKPEVRKYAKEVLQTTGIPAWFVFGPKYPEPVRINSYTTGETLEVLEGAGGVVAAAEADAPADTDVEGSDSPT